ncbi:phosphotransferase [Psychrobium sp. 1_MG-2023]|uniref:protein kinase domain-containing protein n=1 Tax=Psychrobium sp. 1_MG-2023 TaxID=3062624 RepID=UPI000C346237|nr:phosphotransferase [Psychrobium sp. 1_MG-2023]MDP2559613.1 phosphotransferase [Psychrobium sp. 1_MG-2023]PKF59447.1 serine/threonine protein kinase [Alteromonadales bacterium alter-6D02]
MTKPNLQQFYIAEEQSIYLLNHHDATKLRNWLNLCQDQLSQLGYHRIAYVGKGAYGFAFAATTPIGEQHVFKFSRITLPEHVQDRLEEEGFMLEQVNHPLVPSFLGYFKIGKQRILSMRRAIGVDLEQYSIANGPLPPNEVLAIAHQMSEILIKLRQLDKVIIHGDIKPSNIVFDHASQTIGLIDWGSSVYAQVDQHGQFYSSNVMELMSGDLQHSNARLGDVYFIGDEQLNGALSSVRFDEQGLAGTLYALASGQSCRFGSRVIPATSLGLPKEFALTLQNMLSDDIKLRQQAGDYFINNMKFMKNIVTPAPHSLDLTPQLPVWQHQLNNDELESVVYTSRRSFLKEEAHLNDFDDIDDVQLDNYYKNFLQGMGENAKAFLAAVSRLGKYPVVGGLAIHWHDDGLYIDSNLNLYNNELRQSFISAVNNMVTLARAIDRQGIFKACFFNAKQTKHIARDSDSDAYIPPPSMQLNYDIHDRPLISDESRLHSYFEDEKDPDEQLDLPDEMLETLAQMNLIHHTGCIIFESLANDLKIHNYLSLLDAEKESLFDSLITKLISQVPLIKGTGVSGFMKFPYKDSKFFEYQQQQPTLFMPINPKSSK